MITQNNFSIFSAVMSGDTSNMEGVVAQQMKSFFEIKFKRGNEIILSLLNYGYDIRAATARALS
jgi:hypothetical protein